MMDARQVMNQDPPSRIVAGIPVCTVVRYQKVLGMIPERVYWALQTGQSRGKPAAPCRQSRGLEMWRRDLDSGKTSGIDELAVCGSSSQLMMMYKRKKKAR
jgi:hypothetical protein